MPEKITALYRITTPMFIGDAGQKATGISPAAFKGALRFWWRALNWGRIRRIQGSDAAALRQLHKEESELFGSAADQGAGQARAFIRIRAENIKYGLPQDKPGSGVQYLLGQGLYHFKSGYSRESAALSGQIRLEMVLKPEISAEQKQQLIQVVQALGLLGALGSRARKGFGSIALESMESTGRLPVEPFEVPDNQGALKAFLANWQPAFTDTLPPLSAFSTLARVDVSASSHSASELHEHAGHQMQLYRSWGRNGRVGSKPSERNFRGDHDLVLDIGRGQIVPDTLPRRGVFGLPHNYFFSSATPAIQVEIAPREKERNRRASPLLIHIHRFSDGTFSLIQTLLPSVFLPEKEIVTFKPKQGRSVDMAFSQSKIDWEPLHTYLNRFNGERVL